MDSITPLMAIKQKCLKCSHNSVETVANCSLRGKCPLYPFRFGIMPLDLKEQYSEDVVKEMEIYQRDVLEENNKKGSMRNGKN